MTEIDRTPNDWRGEYAQGILYGHATIGLIRQYDAEHVLAEAGESDGSEEPRPTKARELFEEARTGLEMGRSMAEQLGEEWPHYGILADQAL